MKILKSSSSGTDVVLVWDQSGLEDQRPKKYKGGLGQRHWVTFMLFLGMANAYIMRTNMSVAIVAMVNHTALPTVHDEALDDECGIVNTNKTAVIPKQDGPFEWPSQVQSQIMSSFYYGYVITQIPFGVLSKRYGARLFLGVGMLINSVFALVLPIAANHGYWWLILVRFIQGLSEGPIVPCTHAMLAKWIPPNERSRLGAAVYAGAQFGTVISLPLSGLLSEYGFADGWPSIFYVFGIIGIIWSLAFLFLVSEDPEQSPRIKDLEKKYILNSLWGTAGSSSPPIPWTKILRSMPFWAIMLAHMGQNYGYETLMTQLPTYMRQILHFSIKDNGFVSALPHLCMWIFSIFIAFISDWMLSSGRFNHTKVRKIINSIGEYGPAIGLFIAAHTGCDATATVAALAIGVGFNGGIYSGFKVNHLDLSPRFSGILMSFTNCFANVAGMLAPTIVGFIIEGRPTQAQWRIVFYIAGGVYIACATFYNVFGSGVRQAWDNPANDEVNAKKAALKKAAKQEKKANNRNQIDTT